MEKIILEVPVGCLWATAGIVYFLIGIVVGRITYRRQTFKQFKVIDSTMAFLFWPFLLTGLIVTFLAMLILYPIWLLLSVNNK